MADQLIRATAADGGIRAVGAIVTELTNEARRRHKMSAVAAAALGRTMSASLLLASNMKRPQSRVNIRVSGDGELGLVFADAGLDGTVRGFVSNPNVEMPPDRTGEFTVSDAVGHSGFLRVMRDVGYGDPFSSTVELVSGDIGKDIAWYLATSEQTFSKLLVGEHSDETGVTVAGGLLLQIMPRSFLNEDLYHQLERRAGEAYDLAAQLRQGKSMVEILHDLIGDMGLEILPESQPVRFQCRCSFERVLGALKMFGRDEIEDMIEKDNGAEAVCHFCSEVYRADRSQLEQLLLNL